MPWSSCRRSVTDVDTEAVAEELVVNDCLKLNEVFVWGTDRILVDNTTYDLSSFDEHTVVEDWIDRLRIWGTMYVDTPRNG